VPTEMLTNDEHRATQTPPPTAVPNEKGVVRPTPPTRKRLLLLAVAALLSAAAALAIGILVFGDFGAIEGRILGTTVAFAGYALLALPAAILQDRRRLPALATLLVSLALIAAALTATVIWSGEPADALGKATGTVNGWLIATVQVAAVALRRREQDPRTVRWLFAASSTVVVVIAALLTLMLWAEIDSESFARMFGALAVLDALLVALQPILARASSTTEPYRLRVLVAPAETVELSVESRDLASAAADAVRVLERDGRQVLRLEFTGGAAHGNGAPARERTRGGVAR
jgi:hypothetical protein